MRKTKIICTLGPASDTREMIRSLIEGGMDMARFNFSHGTHESHQQTFRNLLAIRNDMGKPVGAILDSRGPEVRIGTLKGGKVTLKDNQIFTLTTKQIEGDSNIVSVTYEDLPKDLDTGKRVLIDDGLIEMIVEEIKDTDIICRVISGAELSNRKGINLPGTHLSMPYISEQDKEDLLFGIRTGFDYVAASFVRGKDDLIQLREFLDANWGDHINIMAKIENADGVNNIHEIIEHCDAVMVARGDMGVEIPLEELPVIQKYIIKEARMAGKQVVTATQMLESMVRNPRPTRAESSDVANAIYDGTSVIMLSGETANGKYPVEAVRTMSRIAERAEQDIDYAKRFFEYAVHDKTSNITDAISHATCLIAYNLDAAAIITVTKTGDTAKMISRFRPDIPIIACTPNAETQRQLSLSWGVTALMTGEERVTDILFEQAVHAAKQAGLVKNRDLVVLTAGVPLAMAGTTNLVKVVRVGE
ncbi:MAG: pyruvate kinase [Christensenellales bacterium]|jgi:pyruvate kinase|nr:pyruvate kinase [Clostridiales bacterium]